MLPVLAGVMAGILSERFLPGIWLPLSALSVSAFLLVRYRLPAVVLLGIVIGWAAGRIAAPLEFGQLPSESDRFIGTVSHVGEGESARSIVVNVEYQEKEGVPVAVRRFRIAVMVPSFTPEIVCGDKVSFSGVYSYPRKEVDLPMENDMSEYYYVNSISLLCFAPPDSVRPVGRSNSVVYRLGRLRSDLSDIIMTSGLDDGTASFLCAAVAGDDSWIDSATREDFAAAGVAHILALSGAHVAVIAMVVSLLLFPLSLLGFRRWKWGVTMAVLWLFAVMTGLSPSVTRSVVMASMVIMALILDRPRSALNSLCLAAVAILLFDPHALYSAGFQLSFVATLFIILFSKRFNPLADRGNIYGRLTGAVAVTTAATFGTMALVAWHFHQFPIYFLAANIVAVALMPVMIGGGVILLVLTAVNMEAGWIAYILDNCYGIMAGVADFFASVPGAVIRGLYFSGWLLVPFYLAVAALLLFLHRKKTPYAVMASGLMIFTVTACFITRPGYCRNELYVTRQKDCTNVIVRHGDTMSVYTTTPDYMIASDSVTLVRRYRDYIGSRGVVAIEMIGSGDRRFPFIAENGGLMFGDSRIVMASSGVRLPESEYCIVTRQFRGDIVSFASESGADTMLVSNDIQARRHKRFCRELRQAGIPYVSLRDSAFTMAY